ncbi:MAG: hypothetical protein AVDCRST_MAG49-3469 [uncultured Thermomicrobiales bacterium]|uniref:Uncharacterized protein n=1 Tax=uncultured Thermomicrobiales bacterium TaxID=1645740 RepID=A0A6J4V5Z7_9BACT|nr:MAG: hypothetical protein AVDCRST_MAG49-3469 [uncultured Thermomicrobiales bacterium]
MSDAVVVAPVPGRAYLLLPSPPALHACPTSAAACRRVRACRGPRAPSVTRHAGC